MYIADIAIVPVAELCPGDGVHRGQASVSLVEMCVLSLSRARAPSRMGHTVSPARAGDRTPCAGDRPAVPRLIVGEDGHSSPGARCRPTPGEDVRRLLFSATHTDASCPRADRERPVDQRHIGGTGRRRAHGGWTSPRHRPVVAPPPAPMADWARGKGKRVRMYHAKRYERTSCALGTGSSLRVCRYIVPGRLRSLGAGCGAGRRDPLRRESPLERSTC